MLDTTTANLWAEISMAERRRDDRLRSLDTQIERYTGPWYSGDGPTEEEETDFENHAYEQISAFVPSTVAEKPRVKITSKRPTAQREVAKALQGYVNRWIRDSDFKELCEMLAVDYMFRWSVAMISIRPRPESYQAEDPLLMPQVDRISPKDFCWDAAAPHPSKARWYAHRYKMDKDDLEAMAEASPDEGWNLEVIEKLQAGLAQSRASDAEGGDESIYRLDRNEVELYDIYIPEETNHVELGRGEEYTAENGFSGTLRTIAVNHTEDPSTHGGDEDGKEPKGVEVREPRPYFGPRTGPYRISGAYFVPDKNEPLSPLVVTQVQSDNHNQYVASMTRSAMAYKRAYAMIGVDEDDAQRLNSAKHDFFTRIQSPIDVSRDIAQLETGGITAQHLTAEQMLRNTFERVSGMSGALKGEVEGGATATAVSEAVDAGQARASWPRSKFIKFIEDVLYDVAWYGYHTEQIVEPLGEEAADLIRADDPTLLPEGTEAWFFGGTFEEGSGGTFPDLELGIDLYSMIRTSEATQRRKGEIVTAVTTQIAPVMPQMPHVRWREVMDLIGDVENVPELTELFNWEVLEQVSGVPMPAPSTPMTATQAGPQVNAPGFKGKAPNLERAAGSLQNLQPSSNQAAPTSNSPATPQGVN